MCEEIWKDIIGFEGIYKISDTGNVFSYLSKIVLKPRNRNGYLCVDLYKNGSRKTEYIHRFLAIRIFDNPLNKTCVDHVDGNTENNSLSNLRWASRT